MKKSLELSLAGLRGAGISVAADDIPDAEGTAAVVLKFSDGTVLKANYWRLIQNGRAQLSSFDHRQKYGLPTPIDAKREISALLARKVCVDLHFDSETADLIFTFSEDTKLQVFNFTSFEIWTIQFPDGTGQYSNYALDRQPVEAAEVKLTKLKFADVHRDGGSYGASFETENGLDYNIWLQRSKMPDSDGLHHRWLFEFSGLNRPEGCLPIVTGSEEEKALLGRLKVFLASCTLERTASDHGNVDRLTELVYYIERREPCLRSDLRIWRLEAE